MTSTFTNLGRAVAVAVALCVSFPPGARAQSMTVALAPAIPQGEFGERRSLGGQIAISIAPSHYRRGFTTRAEFSQAWFPTRDSYARTLFRREGTVSATGVLGYLLYTGAPGRVSLHGGLGIGVYDLNISGRPNPYDMVPGLGLVAGVRLGKGRFRGLVELHQQVVVSDHGNSEFTMSTFVPVRFGVTLETR